MKQKIEELLNKRLNFILEKEFKDITNEEFAVLEFTLTKINTNESEEEYKEKNKELAALMSKMFIK